LSGLCCLLGVARCVDGVQLLRACEPPGFGAMASGAKYACVGEVLLDAVECRYNHLIERAADRWYENNEEPSGEIAEIYEHPAIAPRRKAIYPY